MVNEINFKNLYKLIFLEQSACINPLYPPWPTRTLKFIQKYQRICYIRITEVLRYERAEQMCRQHGLDLAIIDNIHLLEQLKQMNICKRKNSILSFYLIITFHFS